MFSPKRLGNYWYRKMVSLQSRNDPGIYLGAGLRIPFGGLDIFGEWTRQTSASPDATASNPSGGDGTSIDTLEAGLRIYF